MMKQIYPPEFLKLLKSVDCKRPKTVIEHILEHGQITTEELKNTYGYNRHSASLTRNWHIKRHSGRRAV